MLLRMLLLLIIFCFYVCTIASAEHPLTAAFTRDHQLWVKQGNQEIQLTRNQYVYNPKWSYDGRFIGYMDGDEKGEKSYLFIYDTKEKESQEGFQNTIIQKVIGYCSKAKYSQEIPNEGYWVFLKCK